MRLPDAIGIGARRCGSSWVHHALNVHRDVGKPRNGLHFFSEHHGKGIDWYASELKPFANRQVLLEFSVSYLYPQYNEAVAERIAAMVPGARLFACIRDPVSRAFSDYLRSIRIGEYPADMTFEAALERDPVLIERGRFGRLLRPFYDRFEQDQIKVLFYDDLEADRAAYVLELTDYLGLSHPVPPEAFERNEPKGKTLRSATLNHFIKSGKALVDAAADRMGFGDRWSDWKAQYVFTYERVLELNNKAVSVPHRIESRLRAELSSDTAELEAMTGRNLDAWRGV